MTLSEDQNAELELDQSGADAAVLKANGSARKFKPLDLGVGTALVIGGILGLLWLNRSLVSQNAINWVLASRGVESQIDVEEFNARGLKFKNLRIGKVGQETIIAKNGKIDWHYDFGGEGLVIDEVAAQELFGSFAINQSGLDFRALKPLMQSDSSKKPIIIKNVNINDARLHFNTQYGLLRANLGVRGSQESGFSGLANIFVPEQFKLDAQNNEKPIVLGFKTGGFAPNSPSYVGLSALLSGNSFSGGTIAKELIAQEIDGKINASIILAPKIAKKNAGVYFNLYPSKINFARFNLSDGNEVLNGNIRIEKGYLNPNQDFATLSIIALSAAVDAAKGNFGPQKLANIHSRLEVARAEDGTLFASTQLQSSNSRGPFAASQNNLLFKLNTKVPDLSKAFSTGLAGRIGLSGSVNSAQFFSTANEFIEQYKVGDFKTALILNLSANFSKAEGRILLLFDEVQNLKGAQKSQITFIPIQTKTTTQSSSGLELLEKQGQWAIQAYGAGSLVGTTNGGAKINAQIDALNWREGNFGLRMTDIGFANLPILYGKASGKFRAADFSVNNQSRNGNINGEIFLSQSGALKLNPSRINLAARMQNNRGQIALSGELNDFEGYGAAFDKSTSQISGEFAIANAKQVSRLVGNLNVKNSTNALDYGNKTKIQNSAIDGNLDFDFALGNQNKLGKQSKSQQDFTFRSKTMQFSAGEIRSDDFSATNFQTSSLFSISGSIDNANKLKFTTNLNGLKARASRFASKDINGSNFELVGNAIISGSESGIAINGTSCLDYSIDNLRINSNALSKTRGQICPDNSRFANISKGKGAVFANVNTDNFALQMGDIINGQNLELGKISAKFLPGANGAIGINISTEKFNYRFKSGPETWAIIESPSAKIDVITRQDGSDFTVSLENLLTKNLPILAKGAASGKFHNDVQTGLSGEFKFANILIQDSQELKRFGDLTLGGSGVLRNGQISINAEANNTLVGAPLAAFSLLHNLENGVGNIAFEAAQVEFSPNGRKSLQAKDIVPALQGIVEDASGKINGNANFSWAPNKPIQSSGVFSTEKFDFLSPLGPAENISGTIAISDLLKLRTEVRQDIKVGLFHPGVPILDGKVGISFPGDDSIQLEEANWPFADGNLRLRPANWPFSAKDKDLTIDVDDIDVAKFLRLTQIKNLEIDGRMTGFLPIQIRDNEVYIVGGLLGAKDGGAVRYTGPSVASEKPKKTGMLKLKERMFGKPPPQGIELAIEALRDLKYKVLEIRVDGKITGDLKILVLLEGYNKQVFDGHPFLFRINISVPLMQAVNGFKDVLDPNKRFNFLNPDGTLKDNVEIEGVPTNSQPAPQK